MPVKLVFLWSDCLIFLLLAMVALFAWRVRENPLQRAIWVNLFKMRVAQVSLFVLSLYLAIGLMDSLHYQVKLDNGEYDPTVHSVLDSVLGPIAEAKEKTYSAPMAVFSFSKETIESKSGDFAREFPPLIHAGQHLANPAQDAPADIALTILETTVVTLTLVIVLSFAAYYFYFRHHQAMIPWQHISKAIPILAIIVFVLAANVLMLSQHYHLLGTDKIGEDVLYQCLKSIRTGLVIGILTTMIMLPFALLFGALAGFMGGLVDDVIQYIYTTLSSIPGVLLIAAMVLTLQIYMTTHSDLFPSTIQRADARMLGLCFILGITSWTSLCRLIRAETLKLRELEYISAAKVLSVPNLKIITRHILPNVMHLVLIIIALDFSGLVLAEAVLSYVGVGVDPTTYSWGNMINSARLELAREPAVWWSLLGSFVFMFILVLFANIFADRVRDAFDPKYRV